MPVLPDGQRPIYQRQVPGLRRSREVGTSAILMQFMVVWSKYPNPAAKELRWRLWSESEMWTRLEHFRISASIPMQAVVVQNDPRRAFPSRGPMVPRNRVLRIRP
jgi:hypothetical protein